MAIEELAEEVVNEVANNFEEAAEVTRKINAAGVGYFAVGIGIGAAVGFYFGYKFNREKIRAEVYKEAEAEVDLLRTVYLEKTLNATPKNDEDEDEDEDLPLQGTVPTEKPPVDEVVENLGYNVRVPSRERPLPAPVPIHELPGDILDDLPENPVGTSKSMNAGWNYEKELLHRSPDAPYIIHQNEYNHSNPEYAKVIYTYYADDDYLIDTDDNRPVHNGDVIVGVDNLKFGHGSDDVDVVFVRNDIQELDMQICRINKSYEEEELGFHSSVLDDDNDDDDDDDD
jgi:hypothetical protein